MIASRIRKIRELSGWKQLAVADSLNISQQAYSVLEKGAENAKLNTLRKFCDVMNVKLSYLMAIDVAITDESMREYGNKGFSEVIASYHKLEQTMVVYKDLLQQDGKWNTLAQVPLN